MNAGTDWQYPLTDALGSVRGYAGANSEVLSTINYTPMGVPDTTITGPAFTGEWRSENETQYHRARHLHPTLATWLSLDPFEGVIDRSMSLNGYNWVEGNVVNKTDESGRCMQQDLCILLQRQGGVPRSVLESLGCVAAIGLIPTWPARMQLLEVMPFISPEMVATEPPCTFGNLASQSRSCAIYYYNQFRTNNPTLTWAGFISVTLAAEGGDALNLSAGSLVAYGECGFRRSLSDNFIVSTGNNFTPCAEFQTDFIYSFVQNLFNKCRGNTGIYGDAQCYEDGLVDFLDEYEVWRKGVKLVASNVSNYSCKVNATFNAFFNGTFTYGVCPCGIDSTAPTSKTFSYYRGTLADTGYSIVDGKSVPEGGFTGKVRGVFDACL